MNAGKGYRAEARRQWREWCNTNKQDIPFREWSPSLWPSPTSPVAPVIEERIIEAMVSVEADES